MRMTTKSETNGKIRTNSTFALIKGENVLVSKTSVDIGSKGSFQPIDTGLQFEQNQSSMFENIKKQLSEK